MKYLTSLSQLVLCLALSTSLLPAADVTITVDWSNSTGKTTTALHYGMNAYQFSDPGCTANTTYRTNVNYMKAGAVRLHNMSQMNDSTTDRLGWVKNPTTSTYSWDSTKIGSATAFNYGGAVRVMNITGWPSYLADPTGKLKTTEYGNYANFCANLVTIVNGTYQRGIVYWEVPNEKDNVYGGNMTELVKIFNLCYDKMRLADPNIKIGGPAFENPYASDSRVQSFITGTKDRVDFISFHTYSQQDSTSTRQTVWNGADAIGWIDGQVRTKINTYAPSRASVIQVFHNEFNMARNAYPAWQTDYTSMIYDALALRSMVTTGAADMINAWNEADGWWGKLDAGWALRPSAHLFRMINEDCRGALVSCSSSNGSKVQSMATFSGNDKRILLINRSEGSLSVQISATGWSWPPAVDTTCYLHRTVYNGGYSATTVTTGSVTGLAGITLPSNSVTTLGWWGR